MSLDVPVLALIAGHRPFEAVALQIFERQYCSCAPYRRLCDAQGLVPAMVSDWRDIPAIPIEAFRTVDLRGFPPEETVATFHSSGTTAERSTHHFDSLTLYRAAAMAGVGRHLFPAGRRRVVSLIAGPDARPDSSLSRMIGWIFEDYAGPGSAIDEAGANLPGTEPVLVLGTAFGLATLFESRPELRLPAGSAIMETGGFKGQRRELSRAELFALYARAGVPPEDVVGEYGMAELSSQWYDAVVGQGNAGAERRVYRPPPWARTRVVDPATRRDVAPGEVGLLLHVDPVNRGSVQAVLTQDLGERVSGPDGDGFIYRGRAPRAVLKGCGLLDEP